LAQAAKSCLTAASLKSEWHEYYYRHHRAVADATRIAEGIDISRTNGEKCSSAAAECDPSLVFNMSIFNFDDGWNRIFTRFKIHENGT
jgi:hypothetical protein